MKTNELTGTALDWAVAMCENVEPDDQNKPIWFESDDDRVEYTPSTDWAQGGPIIEREFIGLQRWNAKFEWAADIGGDFYQYGETPLIVAMRCYVASRLGDDVDVPGELK